MSLPRFDPWTDPTRAPTRAYRAYSAYLDTQISTPGTIGTLGSPRDEREARAGVVMVWASRLSAARETCPATERACLDAALALCAGPWIGPLLSLGWEEVDLFAYDTIQPKRGGLAQSLTRGRLLAVTRDAAYLVTARGREQRRREYGSGSGDLLIWDA